MKDFWCGVRLQADRVARWRELPRRERRDVMLLAAAIPLMAAGLRLLGYRRLKACLSTARPHASDAPPTIDVERACLALRRARAYGPHAGTCLTQSLALYWLLRRRGLNPDLCIGARLDERVFSAHAWVEIDGRAIDDAASVGLFHSFGRT